MRATPVHQLCCAVMAIGFGWFSSPSPVSAHPHVFIEGSVDFLIDDRRALTGLSITWRYDPFETLYTLSSIGIVPLPDGTLTPKDRERLIRNESDWPDDFDGASHLSIAGTSVELSHPVDLDADLEDGRLVVRFRRVLAEPAPLPHRAAEVAFYERTYFYAFSVATPPSVIGGDGACSAALHPFDAAAQHADTLTALAALGREEVPEDNNIGVNLADRIVLRCA